MDCEMPFAGFPQTIQTLEDYSERVYVDPECSSSAGCCGDGTQECPFATWADVGQLNAPDTAYLQKRGTTDTIDGRLLPNAAGQLIGAYGEGERPLLQTTFVAEGDRSLIETQSGGMNLTVRDLELSAPGLASCVKLGAFTVVYDTVIRDSGWGIRGYTQGFRIIGNEIHDTKDDGIFVQNVSFFEIGNNTIYRVNTNWVAPTTPQSEAAGDGIQLAQADMWWVHDNDIDRTSSGNKFCFIADVTTYGIFEGNSLQGPLDTQEGGASIYLSESGGGQFVIRGNDINGPNPGSSIYTHALGVEIYENDFDDSGVIYCSGSCEVHHNVFQNISGELFSGNIDEHDNTFL